MNTITRVSRRARAAAGTIGAVLFGAIAVACADKEFTPPNAKLTGKVALQITTYASQAVPSSARYILVAALTFDPDRETSGNNGGNDEGDNDILLGYNYVALTSGSQTVPLQVDLSRCPASAAGCAVYFGVWLTMNQPPPAADTGDYNPFAEAYDHIFPIGPFIFSAGRAPVIPPIDLSASRFGVVNWQDDEALRTGGGDGPSWTGGIGVGPGGTGPTAGVANAAGPPTVFTLGFGNEFIPNNSFGQQQQEQFPQLGIFQPSGVWRHVTATAAPNLSGNFQSGFNDITALSNSEVYMSAHTGLYRYDGTAIAKVTAINDSAFAVASTPAGAAQKLIIVGSQGGVVSIGNGTTFTRYTLPTTARIDGVCITGPSEAFASTFNGGGTFRFNGTTWTVVSAQFAGNKFDLQCPAAGQAFVIAGGAQSLLKWNGSAFVQLPSTGLRQSTTLRWGAVSTNEIYAWSDTSSGADRAYYRFNGTSWSEVGRLRYAFGGGRMWATSGAAYVAGPFSRIDRATPSSATAISYQPSIHDVSVSSSTNAFAVGANAFLARYNGTKWFVDPPPAGTRSTRALTSVWSDGPNRAWAVGPANTIYRWDGTLWNKVSDSLSAAGPFDNYWNVWGSGVDAWAVGDNTIMHCKVGLPCALESSGGSGALLGIWGSGPTNIFAAGDNGRITRYNGTTWTQFTNVPTTRRLARLTGTGPNDVWALGDSVLLHFDGSTWTAQKDSVGDLDGLITNHIPSASERIPAAQNQNQQFAFRVGLGFWARSPTEVYIGTHFGRIGRFDGKHWWGVADGTVNGQVRRPIMGLSGSTSGGQVCVLAVSQTQSTGGLPQLMRGVGPSNCFASTMGPVTSWP